MIERIVIRLTARMWNRLASRVLCRAYQRRHINSEQLHVLAREFDPTQGGEVGRICGRATVEEAKP